MRVSEEAGEGEGIGVPGTLVAGGHQLPDVGAGNATQVLWENIK